MTKKLLKFTWTLLNSSITLGLIIFNTYWKLYSSTRPLHIKTIIGKTWVKGTFDKEGIHFTHSGVFTLQDYNTKKTCKEESIIIFDRFDQLLKNYQLINGFTVECLFHIRQFLGTTFPPTALCRKVTFLQKYILLNGCRQIMGKKKY